MCVMQDDMAELLRVLGLGDHARPHSPHEVMTEEIIPAVRAALTATVFGHFTTHELIVSLARQPCGIVYVGRRKKWTCANMRRSGTPRAGMLREGRCAMKHALLLAILFALPVTAAEPFRVCQNDKSGNWIYTPGTALCPCKDPKTGKQCTKRDGSPKGGDELVMFTYSCELVARLPHCTPPQTFRHAGSPAPFNVEWTYVRTFTRTGQVTWEFRLPSGALLWSQPFWAPTP